jgi:hypothetical protein
MSDSLSFAVDEYGVREQRGISLMWAGAVSSASCTLCRAGTYSTAAGGYGLRQSVLRLFGREQAAWQPKEANHSSYSG